jgi:hypothetical protein
MAKHKYPEQRSATAAAQPGQMPAKPTGNEVFDPEVAAQGAQADAYMIEGHGLSAAAPGRSRTAKPRQKERGAAEPEAVSSGVFQSYIGQNRTLTVTLAFALGLLIGLMRPS